MYKCAHAPNMHLANKPQRLLSITNSVMAIVVVMNGKRYKFTNAVNLLLNTPPNGLHAGREALQVYQRSQDTLADFMLEKLFEKMEQQWQYDDV